MFLLLPRRIKAGQFRNPSNGSADQTHDVSPRFASIHTCRLARLEVTSGTVTPKRLAVVRSCELSTVSEITATGWQLG